MTKENPEPTKLTTWSLQCLLDKARSPARKNMKQQKLIKQPHLNFTHLQLLWVAIGHSISQYILRNTYTDTQGVRYYERQERRPATSWGLRHPPSAKTRKVRVFCSASSLETSTNATLCVTLVDWIDVAQPGLGETTRSLHQKGSKVQQTNERIVQSIISSLASINRSIMSVVTHPNLQTLLFNLNKAYLG